jgi:hypothetical protein
MAMKKSSAALVFLLTLGLAACDIGQGNRPESLRFVVSTTDLTDVTRINVFECFTRTPTVLAEFTDGIPGDFTQRVRYTSSNTAVVLASNGDIAVPGDPDQVYNRGVLLPVRPGNAVVTAEFAGLTATVDVTVLTPESIIVGNEVFIDADGVTQRPVTQMAPGSSQQLVATAVFNDGTTTTTSNVSSFADWTTTAPAEVATIGAASGAVSAVAPPATPATYTATASFRPCSGVDGAPPPPALPADKLKLSTTFQVSSPQRMIIVTEPGYPQNNGAMPTGSAQFVRVLADFDSDRDNGNGQDLSFKGVTYAFEPTGVLSYSTASGLLLANSIPAGQTENGPAAITASIGKDALKFTSEPLNMKTFAATLDSVTVSPADVTIAPLGVQLFTASGKFTVNGVAGALTLPVNHDVLWSASDNAVVNISNFTINAGTATSLLDENGPEAGITIRASSLGLIPSTATGTLPAAEANLKIVAPASP